MLVGGFMWAYIIGAVCGTVATMDPNKVKYQQRYDEVTAARRRRPPARRSPAVAARRVDATSSATRVRYEMKTTTARLR